MAWVIMAFFVKVPRVVGTISCLPLNIEYTFKVPRIVGTRVLRRKPFWR
jgi:hypothetical protein